ncbi:hypothetical protein FQN49_008840 [Arthroderma sp. PD_2]|nr:hypothetical protein FQN49_008840 [Arthroderma sp. PD_2]
MFDFEDPSMDQEKCFVSVGSLPPFIDPTQPPQKKSPFSAILGHAFNHKVELILPREIHQTVWAQISEAIEPHRFARAIFPLSALLEGEFFTKYIKIGQYYISRSFNLEKANLYSQETYS